MATLNLFHVTQTLSRLLDFGVRSLLFRQLQQPTPLNVSTMPTERVASPANQLNLHLFHVMEDANYRNALPRSAGTPPVRHESLALVLYYILTAHHEVAETFDAEIQQRNFGLALKIFHDYPIVDDNLVITPDPVAGPQTVMVPGLRGGDNRLEIALRPITPEESLGFWSQEFGATTRLLSAFYEVRTIFIDHEPPERAFGTVLDLGLFVSPAQAPSIHAVRGVTHFTPPAATGLSPQAIETNPARATLAPGLTPPVNRVVVEGTRLAGDGRPDSSRIVLRSAAWRSANPTIDSVAVDPSLNGPWSVQITSTSATFDMQATLDTPDGSVDVLPGIYAVSVLELRRQDAGAGRVRTTEYESNQIAFALGARIAGFDPVDGNGRMGLRVVNEVDLTNPALSIQLAIDGDVYDSAPAFDNDAARDRGHYVREPSTLRFHPLFDPTQSANRSVSLVINGAPSQPFWIEIP